MLVGAVSSTMLGNVETQRRRLKTRRRSSSVVYCYYSLSESTRSTRSRKLHCIEGLINMYKTDCITELFLNSVCPNRIRPRRDLRKSDLMRRRWVGCRELEVSLLGDITYKINILRRIYTMGGAFDARSSLVRWITKRWHIIKNDTYVYTKVMETLTYIK